MLKEYYWSFFVCRVENRIVVLPYSEDCENVIILSRNLIRIENESKILNSPLKELKRIYLSSSFIWVFVGFFSIIFLLTQDYIGR